MRPAFSSPSSTATVAGTTPESTRTCSKCRAASRLPGRGNPWAMSVDSRATIGVPDASASATLGATESGEAMAAQISVRWKLAWDREAVGPRWPWYAEPYLAEPYGFSAGELSRKKQSWPIFMPG